MNEISWKDFEKVELRVGTVLSASNFPEARKSAYRLKIDFGDEIGIKTSSAQITDHYAPRDLIGKQVICVINFPPKQIGPFVSECLTTGFSDLDNRIVLISPDYQVPNGSKLF